MAEVASFRLVTLLHAMRLLLFSDIHGDWKALENLMNMEADGYFACGDLTSWGRGLDAAGAVLRRRGEKVYVLPGNHESESDIDRMCRDYGLNNLHGKVVEIGGWKLAGLGYSNPTPFDTPGEYSEQELAQRLQTFAGLTPLILVCHCPPYGTELDRVGSRHLGSEAIAAFLRENQPKWFFCGHIHETEGVATRIGRTTGINAGKRGYLLELDKIEL